MLAKKTFPATSAGTAVTLFAGPAWPNTLNPQQYAVPFDVSPQVIPSPALSDANLMLPLTSVGVSVVVCVPSPSSPLLL